MFESTFNEIILNLNESNRDLGKALYQNLVNKVKGVILLSLSKAKSNKAYLFSDFQLKDPNGYSNFEALSKIIDKHKGCDIIVANLNNFYTSLNSNAKAIIQKIVCQVIVTFKKLIPYALSVFQFEPQNAQLIATLHNQENESFNQIVQLMLKTFQN